MPSRSIGSRWTLRLPHGLVQSGRRYSKVALSTGYEISSYMQGRSCFGSASELLKSRFPIIIESGRKNNSVSTYAERIRQLACIMHFAIPDPVFRRTVASPFKYEKGES